MTHGTDFMAYAEAAGFHLTTAQRAFLSGAVPFRGGRAVGRSAARAALTASLLEAGWTVDATNPGYLAFYAPDLNRKDTTP